MGATPYANGGRLRRDLDLPDFRDMAVDVPAPGRTSCEPTRELGHWLRDVVERNPETFRIMGPDETASNRLTAVFEATDRVWMADIEPGDDHLAPQGRVMEVLSEHLCQGWLEGYLLTGRHGLFNCYEAFTHIVDSMVNQHAKWLKVTRGLDWRAPISSFTYLLSSHVWRQDHNGFSHQDPGFIDHVVNKKAEVVRVYLPPDANTLLSTIDHCLRSVDYVNVVVAGKNQMPNWLGMNAAIDHCRAGAGAWDWASSPSVAAGGEPDVVLACCGDVPTLETLAATDILRQRLPDLAVRVVNVVDLMRLQPSSEHPHGLSDRRLRRAVHHRQAGRVRLARLPDADPPADLPAHQPPQHPRAGLQGGGHDHHAVRHGHAERPRPVPPGDGRDRPGAVAGRVGRRRAGRDGGPPRRGPSPHPEVGDDIPSVRDWSWPYVDARAARPLIACGCSSSTPDRPASSCGWSTPTTGSPAAPTCPPSAGRRRTTSPPRCADLGPCDAVGHRVVHGGERFREPVVVDAAVRRALDELTDLAPLHQPKSLAALDAVTAAAPDLPAVACFDTAFHATLRPEAATYAVPAEWRERLGVRRYGFHGLSHAYAARRAAEVVGAAGGPTGRIVTCHLGAGASLAAVHEGARSTRRWASPRSRG